MTAPHPTRGAAARQLPHLSLWRRALERRAAPLDVDDWLVEQANLRGIVGAYQARPSSRLDERLAWEEIVVGLCQPHAPADARSLKLVVRILQRAALDPDRLARLAVRERAHFALHWLLAQVPSSERNAALTAVATRFATPPRGYRDPDYRWDPRRLERHPIGPHQLVRR